MIKLSALLIFSVLLFCLSCKDAELEVEKPKTIGPVLHKVTNWNPQTNVEIPEIKFNYHEDGKVKSVEYKGNVLSVNYLEGKISLIKGMKNEGGEESYSITYNSNGQKSKVIYTSTNPKDIETYSTCEYDLAGNLIKRVFMVSDPTLSRPPAVYEYTWVNGNITRCYFTNGATIQEIENLEFDNKLNPLNLAEGIYAIIVGFEQSKNNAVKSKVTSTILPIKPSVFVKDLGYTYDANGYASSMNILNLGGDGNKFYFTK